jgi:hypothetical protein
MSLDIYCFQLFHRKCHLFGSRGAPQLDDSFTQSREFFVAKSLFGKSGMSVSAQ